MRHARTPAPRTVTGDDPASCRADAGYADAGYGDRLLAWLAATLFLLAATLFAVPPALAQSAQLNGAQSGPASPRQGAERSGLLLYPGQSGQPFAAPLLGTDIKVDVAGPLARATFTQRFYNPSKSPVEALYLFPLPEDAAIDGLTLRVGEQVIEGQIRAVKDALRLDEDARGGDRRGTPAQRSAPNLFASAIASIAPGATVTTEISYQQTVRLSDGDYSLTLPRLAAPGSDPNLAAQPSPASDRRAPDRRIDMAGTDPKLGPTNPVTLSIKLNPGFPLGEIFAGDLPVGIERQGAETAVIDLRDQVVAADSDVVVSWRSAAKAPAMALYRERVGDEDYVLAFLTPPAAQPSKPQPRDVIFALDVSGSMGGTAIAQAKTSLLAALDRLKPTDRFNIIAFADSSERLFDGALFANTRSLGQARAFVADLQAGGGTDMLPALEAALTDRRASPTPRVRQVVFLTDGAISNETELFGEIVAKRGRSRVFTVGIGSAPNAYFMRRAAELGRGSFTQISGAAQVSARMDELFVKLESPVLTDLEASVTRGALADVMPSPLPDVYQGEPLVVTARTASLNGVMRISGRYGERSWASELALAEAQPATGIAKAWARRAIAALEAARGDSADAQQIDRRIEKIALQYGLLSRLTGMVAVDVTPGRHRGEARPSREVRLDLPAGGPSANASAANADPGAAAPDASRLYSAAAASPVRGLSSAPDTPADRTIVLGLLLIVFSAMCLVTGSLWRRALRKLGPADNTPRWR